MWNYFFLYFQESDKRQNFQHFRSTMNSLEWLFSFYVFLTCNGNVLAEIFLSFEYLLGAFASALKLWSFVRWEQAFMRTLSFPQCGMDLILRQVCHHNCESQICQSSTLLWFFFFFHTPSYMSSTHNYENHLYRYSKYQHLICSALNSILFDWQPNPYS